MSAVPLGRDREPPNNVEAEQALLGAILVNNQAFDRVADFVRAEHFYDPFHARMFEVVGDLIAAGKKVTPTLLKGYLASEALPPEVDLGKYLATLVADAVTVIGVEDYGASIRDYAARRALIEIGRSVADSAHRMSAERGASPEEQLEEAERRLYDLRQSLASGKERTASLGTLTERLVRRIEDPGSNASKSFSTGLVDLDHYVGGGFRRERMFVTAGRPGMGKTLFAVSTMRRVARAGHGVGFIALEPDEDETAARFLADELAKSIQTVPYRDILRGAPELGQIDRVRMAARDIADLPILVDTTGSLTMAAIEARVRRMRDRFARQGRELALVVIDYLQQIRPSDRYKGRKVDEVGEISGACVEMKKRLGLCVHVLSQLSREVEKRDDKRPTMADLRDSGAIEQDADVVLLAYRPAYYTKQSTKFRNGDAEAMAKAVDQENDMELIVGKNRLGPTGTVNLYCDIASSRVDNKARY